MNNTDTLILEKARQWTQEPFDDETRNAVARMIEQGGDELVDAFYKSLEFGTGGMRGIMGPGTNRMNKYTIGMSTQGLANYLLEVFGTGNARVAIAYDCRNNSPFFAQVCADVLTGNGFEVLLFESLRPTPELSFAIRHYECTAGIMVTASHNPKEYNGYKVYWNDGAQLVPPHDLRVVEEAGRILSINEVNWRGDSSRLRFLGYETDKIYTQQVKTLSMLDPEILKKYADLPMVYSPLHGTGTTIVPMAMQAFGFTNVLSVPQQSVTDGNFPTVISPNPEEGEALKMAIALAEANQADLVMATDPDADRVGIAVRDEQGAFVLLNGNETAVIIIHYLLEQWKIQGKLDGNQYIVKTIVTTYLLDRLAEAYGVACFNVLTGFKYIAEVMRDLEGTKRYIAGGEESYGLLIGDFVRDKDAVSACCIIGEAAVFARSKGMTLYQMLKHIHTQYGVWREHLVSVTRKGKRGAEEIGEMMERVRNNPPAALAGVEVLEIRDFKTGVITETATGVTRETGLVSSNVLQMYLKNGSLITMRPSGTEPKIKFYFSVHESRIPEGEDWEMVNQRLQNHIASLVEALNALME